MAIDPRLLRWVLQDAPRFRVDPWAALAIAMNESGGRRRAVGDSGSSFGAFQLHQGGALPSGRGLNWAASRAGVDYALRQMGSVAGGERGAQAIRDIAYRFERPANPAAEVNVALGYFNRPGFRQQGGGFARGTAVAGMGGGGSAGGGGAAARATPIGGFIPAPIQVQPMMQQPAALNALQTFIAAHTPQANGLPDPSAASLFPQVAPSASSLAGSLDSIHAKLVK